MGLRFTRFSRQKFFVWGNTKGFSLKHRGFLLQHQRRFSLKQKWTKAN